ncbi:DUF523 domain-containing protein [Veillonella sp.]|uniref:DUF523 domain-containing protein n=1 Tax=Veillonella sp. TaxID=1926307 RepID=UPI0025E6E028|nr:DUF523 domain-containing protein [Veillonella sp.]
MCIRILCSACLLGENCKYNGGNNFNEILAEFLRSHKGEVQVVPVCPEVMGGLPVPRVPAEIVNGKVMTRDGVSVDAEFRIGAERALQIAKAEKVHFAILQSRSPSCGSKEIYDGTFSKTLIPGKGVFAAVLAEAGIVCIDVDEIQSISDLERLI